MPPDQPSSDHSERGSGTSPARPRDGEGSIPQPVSNEVVRLFEEQFGRGPTKARTDWAGPDVLVVVLEDTLTPAERKLAEMGEDERLRETLMFFHYATVREFCEPIERLTGGRVKAFASALDTQVDALSVETSVLHPRNSDATLADRAGAGVAAQGGGPCRASRRGRWSSWNARRVPRIPPGSSATVPSLTPPSDPARTHYHGGRLRERAAVQGVSRVRRW